MSRPEDAVPRRRFLARALAAIAGGTWFAHAEREAVAQTDTPYLGEIKMFAGNFAPRDWAYCDGQLLSIAQNDALFNLIGTTYGGDGQTTFALPDLRGRAPIHMGQGAGLPSYIIGESSGSETVFVSVSQMPAHAHTAGASPAAGTSDSPAAFVPATDAAGTPHYGTTADTTLATGALTSVGGSTPHNNMQPYLTVGFIISLTGVFPSQT